MRKRRADARLVREVPPYRRMMPYIMRGRNESAVYFDQELDLEKTDAFLEDFNRTHETRATLFHVIVWAAVKVLDERPRLNRFVAGGRHWQRDGIWISYSAKKQISDDAPIVVVKQRFEPEWSFEQTVGAMAERLSSSRADDDSYTDKELRVLLKATGLPLRAVLALQRFADAFGLLPRSLIENDPMFASVFIANLGSLRMDAAYHHLYEYGNVGVFCVIGQTKETPRALEGEVQVRRTATIRYTFDERVEDGLYAQRALERLRELVESPQA